MKLSCPFSRVKCEFWHSMGMTSGLSGCGQKILGALHAPLLYHCFTSHVILAHAPLDLHVYSV